jgi:hypothetical protein
VQECEAATYGRHAPKGDFETLSRDASMESWPVRPSFHAYPKVISRRASRHASPWRTKLSW